MKKDKKNKKEKNKRKITIYKIIGSLLIISSLFLLGVILYINILPIKYLLIILGVLLVFNLIINFFLFRNNIKKKLRRIFVVLSLMFSVVFITGSFFLYRTFGVLENMSKDTKEYTYHVVVLNNSNYEKLEDIDSKSLGYYEDKSDSLNKALSLLLNNVKTENETVDNLEELGTNLLEKEVDAILIEDSQKVLLNTAGINDVSSNSLSGFDKNTKTIYTFKVEAKIETKEVNVTKEVFNIYLSGMDQYGKVSEVSRSDVNIVVTVNTKTKQILITNIPRDYYVQLHGTSGYKDKLTHAGIYGLNTSVKTIEDLLGIDINYYFKVNFSSVQNIIDALGGVEVYSEYSFRSYNGYNFTKGYNKVNGKEALAFVRERKSFLDGDNQRGKNQQALIEAIFRKCTSPTVITKYNSLLNSLSDSMITNMPIKSMTSLAKMQLRDNAKWVITSNSLKGSGSTEYTYTYPHQALYVTLESSDSLEEAKSLIEKVSNDEMLESSYNENSSNVHSVTKTTVAKKNNNKTSSNKKEEIKKEEIKKEEIKEEIKEETLTEEVTCDAGYEKDESGICVLIEVICQEGYQKNENGECVSIEKEENDTEEECQAGFIKNEEGICIEEKE